MGIKTRVQVGQAVGWEKSADEANKASKEIKEGFEYAGAMRKIGVRVESRPFRMGKA